jgi:hypothetical protein
MKPQLTIMGIMAGVALTATALVSLRSTLEIWASVHFSLTLALLCTAIPGVAYSRGGRRAFGTGFAALGWPYLILCFGPVPGTSVKAPPLLTTKLLECVYPYLSTVLPKEVTLFGEGVWEDSRNIKVTRAAKSGGITFFRNDREDFQRAGHPIGSLVFACVGGFIAQSFASHFGREERNRDESRNAGPRHQFEPVFLPRVPSNAPCYATVEARTAVCQTSSRPGCLPMEARAFSCAPASTATIDTRRQGGRRWRWRGPAQGRKSSAPRLCPEVTD